MEEKLDFITTNVIERFRCKSDQRCNKVRVLVLLDGPTM